MPGGVGGSPQREMAMNANRILVLVLAGAVVCLAGCSTFSKKGDPSAMAGPYDNLDQGYMARINAQAKARGDVVIWVNPPRKDVASTQQPH